MKKTFELTHAKIKTPRLVESIKHDIKKYIKRERRKSLPDDVDYWDFQCRVGETAEKSNTVHVDDINKALDAAEAQELKSVYVEVLVKQGRRGKA